MPDQVGTGALFHVDLLDWRRRVTEIYAVVRAADDPEQAWLAWRTERDSLVRTHSQTPLDEEVRQRFAGLDYFDYDPTMRVEIGLEPIADGRSEKLYAGHDGTVTLDPFARTVGLGGRFGTELTLYWMRAYGGGVFLPFLDGTSGGMTYAGGRYLFDTIKGADPGLNANGPTVLDFNFAYNPSCAYSDRWVCPLAPIGNRLPDPVWAGEKTPA